MLIMKKFYSLAKVATIALVSSFTLFGTAAFSQSTCGPIVENFQNTGGTTAGFTGDFQFGSSGGGSNTNGYLIRSETNSRTIYTIITPTYALAANATSIGIGFQLSGTSIVGTAKITLQYFSGGQIRNFDYATINPGYTGSGSNLIATLCSAVDVTAIPNFVPGGSYRFIIQLTSNTGNGGANDNIIFDNFRTNGTIALAPLPVSFIGFEAKKTSVGIQLVWKIAGEENVDRYEVEKSEDGRNFSTLANIATTKTSTYSYLDASSSGTVYYRIKNVDRDGKFKYSSVVRFVDGKATIVIKAFPQPVLSQLTLQHPTIRANSVVTINSADGRIVKSIKAITGTIQTAVDMSGLQKGLYIVRFDDGEGNTETMKVVKQ